MVEKVLLVHPYLEVSSWMIKDISPDLKSYKLIKERAKEKYENCGIQLSTCFALSKFKKSEDIDFLYETFKRKSNIKECNSWIFRSIEKFPDEKFYPLLINYFENNIKGKWISTENIDDDVLYFSRAVAVYRNEKSLAILRYIEENNTYINKTFWPPTNIEFGYKAVLINYDKIYDPLIHKIQKEYSKQDLNRMGYGIHLVEREEQSDWQYKGVFE